MPHDRQERGQIPHHALSYAQQVRRELAYQRNLREPLGQLNLRSLRDSPVLANALVITS